MGHSHRGANGLRKLRARPAAERRLLVEAVVALALARAAVGLISFRRTASLLSLKPGEAGEALAPAQAREAEAIGWAVRAAAARIPWRCTCLTQALGASALLRLRGIPGTLYLGVTTNGALQDGLAAHAWLRCGDAILVGEHGHDRFTTLASFS